MDLTAIDRTLSDLAEMMGAGMVGAFMVPLGTQIRRTAPPPIAAVPPYDEYFAAPPEMVNTMMTRGQKSKGGKARLTVPGARGKKRLKAK